MLAISELVNVAESVDEDGSSMLAVRAGQAWACNRMRFVRSSANHVFVCEAAGGGSQVLRFRPDVPGAREAAQRVAETARRLAAAGTALAPAVSTSDDRLVVDVIAESKRYVATMYSRLTGGQLDSESLTPGRASSWGRGLARFHEAASRLDPVPSVPSWPETVAEAANALAARDLRAAGAEIAAALRRLPTSGSLVGVVHGDPELDNVIWDAKANPNFVDLDDVSLSWFAADICFALRDFTDHTQGPVSPIVDAFIDGYRECRPFSDHELAWLPLLRRAHAVVTLAGLERVLAERAADDWPVWAKQLHARV